MKKFNNAGVRTALAVAIAAAALAGCNDDEKAVSAEVSPIQMGGGSAGGEGYGGDGGWLYVQKYAGAGDIVVTSDGAANTAFNVPTVQPYYEGALATITGNYTLALAQPATEPAEGLPYYYEGSVQVSNGDGILGNDSSMGALLVKKGATLTLEPTSNYDGMYGSAETAYYEIGSVENYGTIRVGDSTDGERGSLQIYTNYYLGNGTVDVSGKSNPADLDALDAGNVYISANVLINQGRVLATGGAMADNNGGEGGYVNMGGYYFALNAGDIDVRGGNATGAGGYGGSAGGISLWASGGEGGDVPLLNSGDLYARGGNGVNGAGSGGTLWASSNRGPVYNSGAVNLSGGDAGDGYPGYGGEGYFTAEGGQLRNSGAITATGGKGIWGGGGGEIYAVSGSSVLDWEWFYDWNDDANVWAPDAAYATPARNVAWSGNIDLRGGSATQTSGGDGGYALIGADQVAPWGSEGWWNGEGEYLPGALSTAANPAFAQATTVSLYGYSKFESNGASGGDFGGEGGALIVENGSFYFSDDDDYVRSLILGGGISADIDVVAQGGNGTIWAGEGGVVYLASYQDDNNWYDAVVPGAGRTVTHSGNVDVTGGDSAGYGGNGGLVMLRSLEGFSSQTGDVNFAAGSGDSDDGSTGCYALDGIVSGNAYGCYWFGEYVMNEVRYYRYDW